MQMRRNVTTRRWGLVALVLLCAAALGVQAAPDIWWTGEGDGTSWNDVENWRDGDGTQRVPTASDLVGLGYAYWGGNAANTITNAAQNINQNISSYTIKGLRLEPTGERAVTVTGNTLTLVDSTGLIMTENADAPATIDVRTMIVGSTTTGDAFQNNSAHGALLSLGRTQMNEYHGVGPVRLTGRWDDHGRIFGTGTVFVDTPTFTEDHLYYETGATAPVHLMQDTTVGSRLFRGSFDLGLYNQTEEVTFTLSTGMHTSAGTITVTTNYIAGTDGPLLLRVRQWHGAAGNIVTRENTTVEIFNGDWPNVEFGSGPAISGAGSLWITGRTEVYGRQMTYTGRTMLENHLFMHPHDDGETVHQSSFADGAIIEIGRATPGGTQYALVVVEGNDLTVGGLTGFVGRNQPVGTDDPDYTGRVSMQKNVTFTIDAQEASTFAGHFHATSGNTNATVAKAGPETFTLAGDHYYLARGIDTDVPYSLRVEEGLYRVTGALKVETADFMLAGGRIEASSLAAADQTWDVMLTPAYEVAGQETLVKITDNGVAVITGGVLNLTLAEGYEPTLWAEFTLLDAATITGAEEGGAFLGYDDGDTFWAYSATLEDSAQFRINYINGNDSILLTVIPEPGTLGLVGLLLGLGVLLRRRYRG